MPQTRLDGNVIQSGSIQVTAINNFVGQLSASLPAGTVSSSVQVKNLLPTSTVSSSTQLPSGIASSSAQVTAYLPTGTVSSSGQVSYTGLSNIPANIVSSSGQVDVRNTTGIATIATTGSNTFTGIQTINNSTNSTLPSNGALIVSGGVGISGNLNVSGGLTVVGRLTAVSMSTQYVTSSQLIVSDNKIVVQANDLVRFGGLSVYDSGSTSATASIYWDSQNNQFIYENLNGSAYNSAIFIAGPKNTGTLGNETGLTSGYIPYATGTDHIDNSVMFQSGSNIGIGITNSTYKFEVVGGATKVASYLSFGDNAYIRADSSGWLQFQNGSNGARFMDSNNAVAYVTINSTGNVGIGITTPLLTSTNRGNLTINGTSDVIITLGNNGSYAGYLYATSSKVELDAGSGRYLQFNTNGNIRAVIGSDGNVGIGTTIPDGKFDARGNAYFGVNGTDGAIHIRGYNSAISRFNTNAGVGANYNGLRIDSNLNNSNSLSNWVIDVGGNDNISRPGTTDTFNIGRVPSGGSLSTYFLINSSGNVGIGTTNPLQKLDVRGALVLGSATTQFAVISRALAPAGSQGLILTTNTNVAESANGAISWADNANYGATIVMTGNGADQYGGAISLVAYSTGADGNFINFLTRSSSGTITERMRIASGGNVGIGITNPGAILDIRRTNSGGVGPTLSLINGASTANGNAVDINMAGNPGGGALAPTGRIRLTEDVAANAAISFWTYSALTGVLAQRAVIDSVGNVGIGITNPNVKLSLNGDISAGTQGGSRVLIVGGGGVNAIQEFYAAEGNPRWSIGRDLVGSGAAGIGFNDTSGTIAASGAAIGGSVNRTLIFYTSNGTSLTERARIDTRGYFKASNDGTYIDATDSFHEFKNTANKPAIIAQTTNASLADDVWQIRSTRAASSAFQLARFFTDVTGNVSFNFRGDGNAYADGTWNNNGADYAEYFESVIGEALPVGATVVLDGNKVRIATTEDSTSAIMGVVRPKTPGKASMVVGNTAWNKWSHKYLTDDFDCYIMEDHDVVEWTDETGKSHSYESHRIPVDVVVPDDAVIKTHDDNGNKFQHYKLNPSYDETVEYIPREKRDEWIIVGLVGQVKILKGQPVNDRWVKMRDVSSTVEEWMIR